MLPPLTEAGNLPPGVHWTTWDHFVIRYGTTAHRRRLLQGLETALGLLKTAGCGTVYVDGSFVTAKRIPGDFDACWDVTGVDVALLAPIFLNFDNRRAAQKARFHGEFFPAQLPEGISGRTFLDFFQIDKETGAPKGIVALNLGELP